MSEYIISDEQIAENRRLHGKKLLVMPEIVRCRDCRHWQPWMKGAEPECWANGEPFSTPPEGFCAWGERREK